MVIIITSADCLTVIVLCAIGLPSKESTEAELNTGDSNLFLIGYFWREMWSEVTASIVLFYTLILGWSVLSVLNDLYWVGVRDLADTVLRQGGWMD